MSSYRDLTGERFGKYVVLMHDGTQNGRHMWKCRCDCGAVKIVRGQHLTSGRIVSCGCYVHSLAGRRAYRHGMTGTKLYYVWNSMVQRCTNPNVEKFRSYGARGISVCDDWRTAANFFDWCKRNGYKNGLTLDRIDVDGNYEPSNCRWTTYQIQRLNQREMIVSGKYLPYVNGGSSR